MLVLDALEGLAEGLLALLADGKALGECPVLQPFVALFYRGYDLIFLGFEMVGIGNGVLGCLDVILELLGESGGLRDWDSEWRHGRGHSRRRIRR